MHSENSATWWLYSFNAFGMRFRSRLRLRTGFEVVGNLDWQKERMAEIEIQRETEGEMQLRDAEIAPQKNKDFVLTRVSPKYSQKYSINIPLPASQTVTTGMFIMKTLRIGLRGTRNTLAESLTYFCRCSSLMRLQPEAWRASSPSSCACVLFTHCFLHVPVVFVWLCWCVPAHARGNILGS